MSQARWVLSGWWTELFRDSLKAFAVAFSLGSGVAAAAWLFLKATQLW